jgi:hypothetical protein
MFAIDECLKQTIAARQLATIAPPCAPLSPACKRHCSWCARTPGCARAIWPMRMCRAWCLQAWRPAANWSVRRAGCTGFQTAAAPSMKLVTVASKVPRALVCLLSALQFHGLTTRLPWWVWIAMSRGSHVPRLEYPPIRMVQFTGEAYTKDIETREVACHRGARHGEQPARGLSRSKL